MCRRRTLSSLFGMRRRLLTMGCVEKASFAKSRFRAFFCHLPRGESREIAISRGHFYHELYL
eukprot:scaffold291_cov168-Amphora_coffeaeformis.AAC.9